MNSHAPCARGLSTTTARLLLVGLALAPIGARPATLAAARLQALPTVSVADASVDEGDAGTATLHFTVSLSQPAAGTVGVGFQTADGTATLADADYVAASGFAPIPAGQTSLTVDVLVNGDTHAEPDEQLFLDLTVVDGGTIGDGHGVGTIRDDDQVPCTYAIAPTSQAFPAAGGAGTVAVTAPVGCGWTAVSDAAFVTVTSSGGSGDGTVAYSVAANTNPTPRSGTMTIAGLTFTVTQSRPGDPPVLSVDSVSVREGDTGTVDATFTIALSRAIDFDLNVTYDTLDRSAEYEDGDYVPGEGTVTFGPDQPLTRDVTILVNGDTRIESDERFELFINNDGGVAMAPDSGRCTIVDDDLDKCKYSVEPTVEQFSPTGGHGSFDLSTDPLCPWTVTSNAEFIDVVEGSYAGSHTVFFLVSPNPGEQPRSGTITAGDAVFTVEQAGGQLPTVSINSTGVMEGDPGYRQEVGDANRASFVVQLSQAVPYAVEVHYEAVGGNGPGEADSSDFHTIGDRHASFAPGTTTTTIRVGIYGDTVEEDLETFRVVLSDPVNATLGVATGLCRIYDDDSVRRACASGPTPIIPGDELAPRTTYSELIFDEAFVASEIKVRQHVTVTGTFGLDEIIRGPDGTTTTKGVAVATNGTLGTTCSPFPDYVGPFPLAGRLQGTWSLGIRSTGVEGTIDCWCIEARGGSTGLQLLPKESGSPVFTHPRFTATLVENGVPTAFTPLTLRVTRVGNSNLSFVETITTNADGVAEFVYTRTDPGDDILRVELNNGPDVTIAAEATFAWTENPSCVVTKASNGATVAASRRFRDDVLATTERGRRYTALYYRFSGEAVRLVMFNPMLMLRSRELLERYRPVVEAMADGREVRLTRGDLDEIEEVLTAFGDRGSPELRDAIREACRDLRDPAVHSAFHMTITDGPPRPPEPQR